MAISLLPPCRIMYSLGWLSRIPSGSTQTISVNNTQVALFRTADNAIFATQARCPHCSELLSEGTLGAAGTLLCSDDVHEFDLVSGRSHDASLPALKIYPLTISGNGELLLSLD